MRKLLNAIRRIARPRYSASWTGYVWNGKSYDETRNIVMRAETVQQASLLLEKEIASLMMPNTQAEPRPGEQPKRKRYE
jgi:hypothetical protein